MEKPDYEKLWRNANSALEAINAIMWESFMMKDQDFGREQGKWIMAALNLWCRNEDVIQPVKGDAGDGKRLT